MINNLHFFGCSFTDVTISISGYEFNVYRKVIEDRLKINCINHSGSGKSNEHIINDVWVSSKDILNKNETLFIIQTSFLYRLGLYSDIFEQWISLTKRDLSAADDEIEYAYIKFYNDWLKYFYNKKNQIVEFKKNIELLTAYLNENKINFLLIGIDEDLNEIENEFFEKNNFLICDGYKSFYEYAVINKFRICDVHSANRVEDNHFNQSGQNYLAEQIINYIQKF
jgi:hypothetical protein